MAEPGGEQEEPTRVTQTARVFIRDGADVESWEDGKDLVLDILKRIGMRPDDIIVTEEEKVFPADRVVEVTGWTLFTNFDDYSLAIYRDSLPVAGVYMSFRGGLYQAGAYIHATREHLYAHNLPGISGRSNNVDIWEPSGRGISEEIAEEWLLGTGMFDPARQEESDDNAS